MEFELTILKETSMLACYSAADGSNGLAKLSSTRLVYRIDPLNYFKMNIPNYARSKSRIAGPRRKYQVAYLLMIHGDSSIIENVGFLLKQLDDGSAIILIHVDTQSDDLYDTVNYFIKQREAEMNAINRPNSAPVPGNVFMATHRYRGRWGHISLMWMQLSGFFELMDMADWDHVINLSAFNVPLRKGREIQRILNLPTNKGKNFVSYWGEYSTNNGGAKHPNEVGLLFPPFPRWRACKHHQWVILSREFVEYIRESSEVAMTLAFTEQTWIPDESFFCYVLINTPRFSETIINENMHFIQFPANKIHPKILTIEDAANIGDGDIVSERDKPRYLFARKIDIRSENGKELVQWILQHHINKHLAHGTSAYPDLGGKNWVLPDELDQAVAAAA
ncbi:hypothetical protein HDU96_001793 [Phlyctochytrium bullatum]|nr:hypothetical protein HDU96_001793 [Phlyctochytrium bullatum]